MNRTSLAPLAAAAAALLLGGCSLLKVSVDTGNPPLPERQAETRMMTRGFYYDLTDEIGRTADSLAAASPEIPMKIRAIRWKMQATRAAVAAAMQSNPDVALIDTWLLCARMDSAFRRLPDSLLFGERTPLARKTTARLSGRAERLAQGVLPKEEFGRMREFVAGYMAANPVTGSKFTPVNTTLPWIEYLREKGVETRYNVGSISDVIADLGDRFGGESDAMVSSIGWSKDIFELQMQQDSLRSRLTQQLDSLGRDFDRMVAVMEHLPQIADYMGRSLNEEMTALIGTMNDAVDNAFADLDRQRTELQRYASAEREAIINQAREAVDTALSNALDRVPGLVARLLLWIVLFAAAVLGIPFGIGFWLGRLRERTRAKKNGGA
ncbi:MAG: hypothetical protein K2H81_05845 [Alistipes sp.]|nr:hypothetical protein [Alistipes sp.]